MAFVTLIKQFFYAGAYLLLAVGAFFLLQAYESIENENNIQVIQNIKRGIDNTVLEDKDLEYIKSQLQENNDTVFFIMFDPLGKRGVGYVNLEVEERGGQYIKEMIVERGMQYTFDALKTMQAPPHDLVKQIDDYWIETSLQVKYGYLNPMKSHPRPKLLKTAQNTMLGWYGLGLIMFLFHMLVNMPAASAKTNVVQEEVLSDSLEEEKENIKYLQDRAQAASEKEEDADEEMIFEESDTDEEGEDVTNVDDIPSQVWIRLLEEPDLKDWEVKGNFYVRKDKKGIYAIGFPWGSSIVTRKELHFDEFIFEAEGRILSGNEGFIVLFPIGEHQLVWVLGGWSNNRSEVLGYDATRTFHQIHQRKWYHIRVELEEEEITGYIDGRTAWTLKLDQITQSSPDVDMQKGLGVGVWKTTTKFRNIRVLKV